jgi:hypothetical protein
MSRLRALPNLISMTEEHPAHRVEVSFVGPPPVQRVARASGVSEVRGDGKIVHCLVVGSIQPFLEALHGHEVITLWSTPAVEAPPSAPADGGR